MALIESADRLDQAIEVAVRETGLFDGVTDSTRVALKPNLTYPYYKAGVTTSPAFIRETVRLLRERTAHIAIVESDGGYGAWQASDAFAGHGLYALREEFGAEIVNLCAEPSEMLRFRAARRMHGLPLPRRLLHETDLFVTMPVPKIHAMTGVSLAFKNQWGCIPDSMRLRRHCIFDHAIVAINRALQPVVLADGTYFLDVHGPMEGTPVRANRVIAATDPGSFDRYVCALMGIPWQRVGHLRRAAVLGEMPTRLESITFNVAPAAAQFHQFHLERSLRNWIALAGFKSRFLTWLGYESWFGRVVLHAMLYAIAGRPVGTIADSPSPPSLPLR